jgi:hypothetical protein
MNKLTLALATAAIAAGSSTFVTTVAEAGGRGFRMHHFLRQHHFNQQRHVYRHHDDDEGYVRRKKKVTIYAKPVAKPVEKPVAKVAVAKFADGEGRQFDLVSKVWFDGGNQCWMGDKAFVFKSGTWLYGNVRWIESNDSWRVASGDAPEQVSCEGIKAFEGKVQQAEAKPVVKPAVAKKAEPKPEKKIEQAELQPIEKTGKTATTSVPAAKECKKYFPSVGEMVSVPCSE